MGVYDQAARFAADAAPQALVSRVLMQAGAPLVFREWLDTRTLPLPGGQDRTADRIAALDDPACPDQPWLLVFEFQAQPDPDKLGVTLEEVAALYNQVRHGPERQERYKVLAAIIHLKGKGTAEALDLTWGAFGTRHVPINWNVGEDDAATALQTIADRPELWGLLFWVPLMAGGGDGANVARWKELAAERVTSARDRGNLTGIVTVFAELAGCLLAWEHSLEGWEVTESQVVNRWIDRGRVESTRSHLILTLNRFGDPLTQDLIDTINQQTSLSLLEDWFKSALQATSMQEFLKSLRG